MQGQRRVKGGSKKGNIGVKEGSQRCQGRVQEGVEEGPMVG